MNWQTTSDILSGLGVIALLVGLLLRFKVGRWLLAGLWLIVTLGSLFSGDWHGAADNPDVDDPQKASRYWLWGGGILLAAGIIIRSLVGSK
ncbi:hypothetical protein Q5H93_04765 [Hymenobacter sp. ASUV-10]|uniref:Uncharacterized protein n=1 Tax=Hymenobacter aranciens TaxID=3063996 RepID=A0ABT9B6X9_9BACT|nr:hypothetical protein [Hymenobacter sp. ASUV-10]MDO7874034.1 hypothetical protein [Hymenobacter sp. ASUV-10]